MYDAANRSAIDRVADRHRPPVWHDRRVRIPAPALVVLVGPSGAGKSTWAAAAFAAGEIVSSDRLRAVVGEAEDDLAASGRRVRAARRDRRGAAAARADGGRRHARPRRRPAPRRGWPLAARHGRAGGRARVRHAGRDVPGVEPRPAAAGAGRGASADQLRKFRAARGGAAPARGSPRCIGVVPDAARPAAARGRRGRGGARRRAGAAPVRAQRLALRLAGRRGGDARRHLRQVAADAEAAGFESIWLMDHVRQIPQVGRAWEDLPEAMTTLGFLAACTTRARLGALVAGITYRNVAHLGRIVATLDVLSGGRAVCGLGAAWFEEEHRAYGWPFPPVPERLDLVADALELLPLLWGPGAPAFRGRVLDVPEAVVLPAAAAGARADHRRRPGRAADAAAGGRARRRLQPVRRSRPGCGRSSRCCTRTAPRSAAIRRTIEVTHLSTALAAPDGGRRGAADGGAAPGQGRRRRSTARASARARGEQVERYAALAEAGVQTAIVRSRTSAGCRMRWSSRAGCRDLVTRKPARPGPFRRSRSPRSPIESAPDRHPRDSARHPRAVLCREDVEHPPPGANEPRRPWWPYRCQASRQRSPRFARALPMNSLPASHL